MKSNEVENEDNLKLTQELKAILDERLQEDEKTYFLAEESIKLLKLKYDLE